MPKMRTESQPYSGNAMYVLGMPKLRFSARKGILTTKNVKSSPGKINIKEARENSSRAVINIYSGTTANDQEGVRQCLEETGQARWEWDL